MADRLRLPIDEMTQESKDAFARVYDKMGSITKCVSPKDFGLYRCVLIEELDKEIRKLKKKAEQSTEKVGK